MNKKKQSSANKLNPEVIYILIYCAITIILFAGFIFSDKTIFGTDYLANTYFMKSFYKSYVNKYGTLPLWDPYIHGGMPFVEAMHGDTFYPFAWLAFIMPVHRAFPFKYVIHIFLAALFTYLFFKEKGLKRSVAFLGGIIWMLVPVMVSLIYAGHDGKIHVTALLPLFFYLVEKCVRSSRLFHYVIFGLCYGILILTAHLQMTYFASWGFGLYYFYRLIVTAKTRKSVYFAVKNIVLFALAILIGLGIGTVQLLPQYKYVSKYSMRTMHTEETKTGYEYATSWSLHPEEIISLFLNDFVGISVGENNSYWGRNPFKLNSDYIGILILFFALAFIILSKDPERWFWVALAFIGFIYSLGANTPLFRIFYWLVPGVRKFRGPSMIIFLTAFSLLALALFGLNFMLETGQKKKTKDAIIRYAITFLIFIGVIGIISTILGNGLISLWKIMLYSDIGQKEAIAKSNIKTIIGNFWAAIILSFVGFMLVYLWTKGKIKEGAIIAILAFAFGIDYFRVDKKFIITTDINKHYPNSQLIEYLQSEQTKEPFRVLILPNALPDNYLAKFGIEEVSFTAMHGNHLRLYDEFVGRHERTPNLIYPRFWDLLNVKFVISTTPYDFPFLQEIKKFGNLILYKNLNYLPRAFPVFEYQLLPHEKVLDALKEDTFPYRRMIILEKEPGITLETPSDTLAEIVPARIIENKINMFTIELEMKQNGFLFLSENYYPAWHAYENGEEKEILVANYTFRAVPLEKGYHRLIFRYVEPTLAMSFRLSIGTAIFAIILITILLLLERRKRQVTKN